MPTFKTDQALWYNVGVWGELGYAVPNFGDDPSTLNDGIHYLTTVVGRNLSAIMHHPDCDLRTPPSINTLTRLHKLILRSRQILAGRDVAPGEPDMESTHTSPATMVHLIFPVPYFKVRNHHLRQYCGLVLNALAEMMQHTENRKPYEISTRFSGMVGQYFHRVYRLMATELFGIDPEKAKALDFTLSDAELKAYDPGRWFTSTEMIDTVSPLNLVPTEDDLVVLTDGIPATQLVGLSSYPSGTAINAGVIGGNVASSATSAASFAAPLNGALDMQVRDRITELRRVPASSLRPNPRNWRAHPAEQQDALRGLLAEVGFADALIARELPDGSLELIDGHLRAELTPEALLPVLVLDVNEAEADLLLASLDMVTAMAQTLPLKLDHLLARLDLVCPALGAMLDQHAASAEATDECRQPIRKPEKRLSELFHIIVMCGSEAEQRRVFERLRGEGYQCKLQIL